MVYLPVPKKGFSQKLLPKWDGPYEVIDQLSSVSYRVKKDNKVLVLHVQRLMTYTPWEQKVLNVLSGRVGRARMRRVPIDLKRIITLTVSIVYVNVVYKSYWLI